MIGYILMGLGAYLVADEYFEKRRAKNAKLLENGNVRGGSDSDRKQSTNGKESDRNGRVKPFPVNKQGGNHDISKKPIQPVGIDKAGSRAGDDSNRQPDAASSGRETEGVTDNPDEGGNNESNLENGISNDGDNVDSELPGINEPDSTKIN